VQILIQWHCEKFIGLSFFMGVGRDSSWLLITFLLALQLMLYVVATTNGVMHCLSVLACHHIFLLKVLCLTHPSQ
jgi:hypothetical protein